ncbi:MAG: hypothetical protein IKC97_03465 [Clostridia bacterium]|nr:hypothetical protein [Clostridia bacterium]
MKRFLLILLSLLCVVGMVMGTTSCQPPVEPNQPEQPEQPENPVTLVDIVKDGKTDYRIVRRDAATGEDAARISAMKLTQAIKTATGCNIELTTDWTPDDDGKAYEILIGKVDRPAYDQIPKDLAKDEFVILFIENKILIDGGSESAITNGVNHFIKEYLGYDEAKDTYAKTDLAIPEALNLRQAFDYPYEVYIIHNIKGINGFTNNEDYNDIVRLYSCLQGSLNKNAKENGFYVYQNFDSTDPFWLEYISGDGKMLQGCVKYDLKKWSDLWDALGSYIIDAGIVVWDPTVPATANVASTICSVEGYLPVRYDEDEDSLYTWLTSHDVKVREDLCDMFFGVKGTTIADTDIPSTGSIKCDPYLWALEKYGDDVNPEMIAYTLDGASQVASNIIYQRAAVSTEPSANQLYSHDYYIYNECFFVDLTCKKDERPCDDPDQPMGTDAETLGTILGYFQDRNNGKFGKLMGFPPWYMKYTVFNNWGSSGEVELEWAFVAFITQYDFIKEADAWNPSWMTNASVYCQYEMTTEEFENNDAPLEEEFDENVRYFTMYIGDYDSSAWLKLMVPDCFQSDLRGQMPMMWAFNPNLSDRVPMIFDYVYENKTPNDYFVTGDSGAGYVFPSRLNDIDKWIDYNRPYLDKFDMDVVGFIIDDHKLSIESMKAYAEISPFGAFTNTGDYLTILDDETVFLRMWGSVQPPHNTDETREQMYQELLRSGTNFAAYRTIRQYTPDLVGFVNDFIEYANAKNDGYTYKYVDMYTLFDLILQSGQGKFVYSE